MRHRGRPLVWLGYIVAIVSGIVVVLGALGMIGAILTGDQDPQHGGAMLFFAGAYVGGLGAWGVIGGISLVTLGRWIDSVPGPFKPVRWTAPLLALVITVCSVLATAPLIALTEPGFTVMAIIWILILLGGTGTTVWLAVVTWRRRHVEPIGPGAA
jgi:hypothetical protein